MDFRQPAVLGRTGLSVGRLGVASGYRAPAAAIEEAFEHGCNYFTWGTVVKGFSPEMRENLAVLDRGPMSGEELARLGRIGDRVHG